MTRDKGRQSAKAKTLSANRLRKLLNYAPATGVFRWRAVKASSTSARLLAAFVRQKVTAMIRIDGKLYRANRLAWLYMTGKWPKQEIGYINRNTSDTRWANLWVMTPSQRGASTRRRNKLGVRGVWITKSGKYVAYIRVAGKKRYLGVFDTVEKANVATPERPKTRSGNSRQAR